MISRRPISKDEALARAQTLCAAAEMCRYEIDQKLVRWGIGRQAREEILDALEDERFLDDSRFAAAYVRDKARYSRWGRRKIAMGLAAKRVASGVAREAIAENIDEDEYVAALAQLLQRKAAALGLDGGELAGVDRRKAMEKLYAFAVGRGYESDAIRRGMNEADIR